MYIYVSLYSWLLEVCFAVWRYTIADFKVINNWLCISDLFAGMSNGSITTDEPF